MPYKNHINTCSKNKNDLWSHFMHAREVTEANTSNMQAPTVASVVQATPLPSGMIANDMPPGPATNTALDEYRDAHPPASPLSKRIRRMPAKLLTGNLVLNNPELQESDVLPISLVAMLGSDPATTSPITGNTILVDLPRNTCNTQPNTFGVFQRYTRGDSPNDLVDRHDPDSEAPLSAMLDIPTYLQESNPYAPFPNKTSFLLSHWFWNRGAQKSKDSFRQLLDIIGNPSFIQDHIATTNWSQIDCKLGINSWDREEWQDVDAGWTESSVQLTILFHRNTDHPGLMAYTINGFYHRSLTTIIREKLTLKKQHSSHFHLQPYELLWQQDDDKDPLPLSGEMYSSPAFLRAHQEVQDLPGEPGCTIPRVVVALMAWSDATHLMQFGSAKIMPLYIYFGNESKYRRSKPSCRPAEHVAFFQQLPDSFKDFATCWTGMKKVTLEFMAFCNRELAHEQWHILLNAEFLHAYEHGMVLDWVGDSQKRRFYPWFITYSADYPEKVLMASICQLGGCPCPRCKIPKNLLRMMGTDADKQSRIDLERRDDDARRQKITKAQKEIYGKSNLAVDSAAIERELKPESLALQATPPGTYIGQLLHPSNLPLKGPRPWSRPHPMVTTK
ncbi:hypothetical protein DXG01_005306 [Tephrocybe rancida]|nr:hypothetical protein DXG01_005306 [Tephrocybe rancida]